MTDRTTLLKEIDEVSFALNDVTLYLDKIGRAHV